MSNNWFQFKQFHIGQARSALKVGTDGVLLGAWSMVQGTESILDVGTGTGVIALMLAQRSTAQIHALEMNGEACKDAADNFRNSPWEERLVLFHTDFNDFCKSDSNKYDLIVCNPPFFIRSLKSADAASSMARHDGSLSFLQLITGAKNLMKDHGRLCVIIPFEALDDFRESARLTGFYLSRRTVVIPKTGKAPKRVLFEFSVSRCLPEMDELVILDAEGRYSGQYKELTKEFYLN